MPKSSWKFFKLQYKWYRMGYNYPIFGDKKIFDENYCSLRILVLKKIDNEQIELTNPLLRTIMCNHSYREQPYIIEESGMCLMDSCPIICHKESLPVLIIEIISNLIKIIDFEEYNVSFILNNMTIPFAFCNRPNHCIELYGDIGVIIPTQNNYVYSDSFNLLVQNVNKWKVKLKRKGRRALKKSITLRPI